MAQVEPIIGSSFDSIAAQRQFWANQNRGVEEDNLRRLMQAEQIRNNYFQNIAQMQQGALERDAAMAMRADDVGRSQEVQRRAEARRAYEFETGVKLDREKLATEGKRYEFTRNEKQRVEKQGLDAIDRVAQFMAPDIDTAGRQVEDAQDLYQKQARRIELLRSEIEPTLPPGQVVYNPKTNEFVPALKNAVLAPEVAKVVQVANQELAKANADYESAATLYATHLNNFDTLRKQAASNNLQVSKRGNRWVVYSPLHDKTYGEMVEEARSALPQTGPPLAGTPEAALGWMQVANELQPNWFTQPSAAASQGQQPSAPSGMKVGRFIVTPAQ